MKIALISFGSRGDIEPFFALGEALSQAHQVCFISNEEAKELATANVKLIPLAINVKRILQHKGKALLTSGSENKSLKVLAGIIMETLPVIAAQLPSCLMGQDLIIINERYFALAYTMRPKMDTPMLQVCFQPKGATDAYPYLYFRPWYFSFFSNQRTHAMVDKMLVRKFLKQLNPIRKKLLNAPPLSVHDTLDAKQLSPLIQGFSKFLFQAPGDWKFPTLISGNWQNTRQTRGKLADDLQSFLATEKLKLYIGFGSMLYDPNKVYALIKALIQYFDCKVLWATNWNAMLSSQGLKELPGLKIIQDGDHYLIFPELDLVMHHGGSGTVNTAARLGKPQIISWFMLDQRFWAQSVEKNRLGKNVGSFYATRIPQVVKSIEAILQDKSIQQQVQKIASFIQAEDGIQETTAYIEDFILRKGIK